MQDFESYEPGRLGLGGDEQFAREAWAFLNRPEIVEGMKAASDLGHPAVAGIRDALLDRFRDRMNIERHRQRIGHMVRQIIEREGYQLDQLDVKVNLFPFSKAARYRRRDAVLFHVFRASSDPRELCITATRNAHSRLPVAPGKARWMYWTQITSKLQAAVALGAMNIADLRQQITTDGYARHRIQRALRPSRA